MSEPSAPGLPPVEVWRSRLSSARRRAPSFRAFAEKAAAALRETGVFAEMGLFWVGGDRDEVVQAILGTGSLGGLNRIQRRSFEKAVRAALREGRGASLAPGTGGGGASPDTIESRPWTEDDLPLYNGTRSWHWFLPVKAGGRIAGVLHAVGAPGVLPDKARVAEILGATATEIEAFFREQSPEKISRQVAAQSARTRLLESVLGEGDPDEFGLQVVNHVQSLLGCSRVSLFTPSTARGGVPEEALGREHSRFGIRAASGLVEVRARSAEAVFLKDVAHALLRGVARQRAAEEKPAAPGPGGRRPTLVALAGREAPEDADARDPIIADYFQATENDWILALALRGSGGLLFGMLLIEGRGEPPDSAGITENLASLDTPLGRTLERVLARQGLRGVVAGWLAHRSRKRVFGRLPRWAVVAGVAALLAIILALPVDFDVRADARVFSEDFRTLASPFRSPVAEVLVGRGDRVGEGDLLARLDVRQPALRRLELSAKRDREEARRRLALLENREDEAILAELEARVIASELRLLDERLAASVFRAPGPGVVVGPSNLRHSVGSYVNEGDAVIEMAGTGGMEMVLFLREQDLLEVRRRLAAGEEIAGWFRPTSDSGRRIAFILEPGADYPLYADQTEASTLRYGLRLTVDPARFDMPVDSVAEFTGKTTLELGRRSLGYVTFRDFFHFLRIRFL